MFIDCVDLMMCRQAAVDLMMRYRAVQSLTVSSLNFLFLSPIDIVKELSTDMSTIVKNDK